MRLAIAGATLTLSIMALPSATLAQGGPEEPVRGLFQAIAEKRFEDAGQFFCPEFADQAAQMDLNAALAGNLPPGVDPQDAADAIAFDVTGPDGTGEATLSVGIEDPNGTPIVVDALLTANIDPTGSEAFMRAIVIDQLEAQGMAVNDQTIAAAMVLVEQKLAGMEMFRQPIQTTLIVTQGEDGSWLICSPIQGAGASPGASVAPASSPALPPASSPAVPPAGSPAASPVA
jgi:hypothetical protein